MGGSARVRERARAAGSGDRGQDGAAARPVDPEGPERGGGGHPGRAHQVRRRLGPGRRPGGGRLGADRHPRLHRHAHPRAAPGRPDGRRVRRADPQGVAALPGAPGDPGDAHRAGARVHHAARRRKRGGGLRRRGPEARGGGGHRGRPAALRGDEGARAHRRLRPRRHRLLLGAADAEGRPVLRWPRRLPPGGPRSNLPRRRLDQGLRRPRLLQAARRAESAASPTSPRRR